MSDVNDSSLKESPPSDYPGQGTLESPYLVSFLDGGDPENPRDWSSARKWL
jgi:hypothetical protein